MRFSLLTLTLTLSGAQVIQVYNQPGIGGGSSGCGNEPENLISLLLWRKENDASYASTDVKGDITTMADPDLATKLAAADFFFMPDMENAVAGWDATSQGIINTYITNGGVMLMTGTGGSADADFLNAAFGWDTSSTSCGAGAAKNTANTAGTAFDAGAASTECPSATDHINCGTTSCIPMYGDATSASVAVFTHGSGTVVYAGWDFYNAGRAITTANALLPNNGGVHQNCGAFDNAFIDAGFYPAQTYAAVASGAIPGDAGPGDDDDTDSGATTGSGSSATDDDADDDGSGSVGDSAADDDDTSNADDDDSATLPACPAGYQAGQTVCSVENAGGSACIFPFKYYGYTFTMCTTADAPTTTTTSLTATDGQFALSEFNAYPDCWCPTQLDVNGVYEETGMYKSCSDAQTPAGTCA